LNTGEICASDDKNPKRIAQLLAEVQSFTRAAGDLEIGIQAAVEPSSMT
jgi:hypothetical protein